MYLPGDEDITEAWPAHERGFPAIRTTMISWAATETLDAVALDSCESARHTLAVRRQRGRRVWHTLSRKASYILDWMSQ